MKTLVRTCITSAVVLAAALTGGCASNARTSAAEDQEVPRPAKTEERGPNPGAAVAGGCGRVALESLRLGPLGIPVGAGVLVICMPLAVVTAVVHEVAPPTAHYNDSTGAPNFAYPGNPTGGTVVGGRGSSGYAYPGGFFGDCYGLRCGR